MNTETSSPADSSPAQDRATEALLHEYARLQSHDDTAFLAAFEQRLAQETADAALPVMATAARSSHARAKVWMIVKITTLAAAACVVAAVAWQIGQPSKHAEPAVAHQKTPTLPSAVPKPSETKKADAPSIAGVSTTLPKQPPPSVAKPQPATSSAPVLVASVSSKLMASAPTSSSLEKLKHLNLRSELGLTSSGSEILDLGDPATFMLKPEATYDYQPPLASSIEATAGGFAMTGTLKFDDKSSSSIGSLGYADQESTVKAASGAVAFQPGTSFGVFGDAIMPPDRAAGNLAGLSVGASSSLASSTPIKDAGALTLSGNSTALGANETTGMLGYDAATSSAPLVTSSTTAAPPGNQSPVALATGTLTMPAASSASSTSAINRLLSLYYVGSKESSYTGDTSVTAGTPAAATVTYNGGTTVNEGKIIATAGNTQGRTSSITTVSGTISGAGGLTKAGKGTLTLTGDTFAFSNTGGVASANTLSFGNSTAFADYITTPDDKNSSGNRYDAAPVNPFLPVLSHPLSTFSIDVDTASYANIRRLIQSGAGVPPAAVRLEEMINYFPYSYVEPKGDHPIAVKVESAACPWAPAHRLVKIALKAKEIDRGKRAAANLVFLVDVSGSMSSEDKLALVMKNLRVLTAALNADDTVSIVTYAGNSGIALPPTSGDKKKVILGKLDSLSAGGSTNGAGGIMQAYELAKKHFIKEGVNRVVLCTDGDFNVGITGKQSLVDLVKERAQDGIFLTVCGYGQGNLNDAMLEAITDKGNGVYHYIDSEREGRKVFQDELFGTLVTVAKDVKLQIEFNPAHAAQYRLIGYDNRMLAKEDFANDKVDAGDIGAGHRVTALYEVIPSGAEGAGDIPLKYQAANPAPEPPKPTSPELLTVKLRYKEPTENTSKLFDQPFTDNPKSKASADFVFAAVVAEFGNWLRGVRTEGRTLSQMIEAAEQARGEDPHGYRAEFIELMKRVK